MSQGSNNFQYPTAVDQFITWEDDIDNILASSVNNAYARIIATQTELGTDPAGSMTDVKTRLAVSLENDGTLKANTVDTDQIVADAVDKTKIAADVAGNGIVQAAGGELDVNVDDSTIEIDTDVVQVKDDGIVKAKIADDQVDETHLDLGNGANQVDHETFGFQKTSGTVVATNGELAVTLPTAYGDADYSVFLCPTSGAPENVWAVVKTGTKVAAGFTIQLRQPGTNGAAPYNADAGAGGNVVVDIITLKAL